LTLVNNDSIVFNVQAGGPIVNSRYLIYQYFNNPHPSQLNIHLVDENGRKLTSDLITINSETLKLEVNGAQFTAAQEVYLRANNGCKKPV